MSRVTNLFRALTNKPCVASQTDDTEPQKLVVATAEVCKVRVGSECRLQCQRPTACADSLPHDISPTDSIPAARPLVTMSCHHTCVHSTALWRQAMKPHEILSLLWHETRSILHPALRTVSCQRSCFCHPSLGHCISIIMSFIALSMIF